MVKKWKFRGGGGAYVKFPPWWGYGYFPELHNKLNYLCMKSHDQACFSILLFTFNAELQFNELNFDLPKHFGLH